MSESRHKIDCRRARELLSRQMDARLEPGELALLKIHLAVCDFCVRV